MRMSRLPRASSKPAASKPALNCSVVPAACYCLLFSCFCCSVLSECLLTCQALQLPVCSPKTYYCFSSLPDFETLSYPLNTLSLFSGPWFPSSCCSHFANPSCCSHSFFFPTILTQASWRQRLLTSASISGHGSCFFGCAVYCFTSVLFGGVYPSETAATSALTSHCSAVVACCTLFEWLLDIWRNLLPGTVSVSFAVMVTCLKPSQQFCIPHVIPAMGSRRLLVRRRRVALLARSLHWVILYKGRLSCWHTSLSTPFAFIICCSAASTTDSIFPKTAVFKRDSIWSTSTELVLISHVLQCPLIHHESEGLVQQSLKNSLSTSWSQFLLHDHVTEQWTAPLTLF